MVVQLTMVVSFGQWLFGQWLFHLDHGCLTMVVFVVVVFDTGKPAPVAAAHGATDSAHAGGTGLHAHWDTVERSDPGHNGG